MLARQLLIAGFGLLAIIGQQGAPLSGSSAPQIAITIDDLNMIPDDTPRLNLDQRNTAILDTLRRSQLKAVLFVCGMRVDNEIGTKHLRMWDAEGHILANHGYLHLYFPETEVAQFSADVLRGEAVLRDFAQFRRLFRFPFLKEGDTIAKRDQMRVFLKEHGYRVGHVTVDTSEWAIDARLRRRLASDSDADLSPYRDFYLEHVWNRTVYYDDLAKKVLGRPVKHTLLVHHNLVTALFLDDLLQMFENNGWDLIDAEVAFTDPIFSREPDIAPAGESIVWALAKESGRFDSLLRYPGEDGSYEEARMDALGL